VINYPVYVKTRLTDPTSDFCLLASALYPNALSNPCTPASINPLFQHSITLPNGRPNAADGNDRGFLRFHFKYGCRVRPRRDAPARTQCAHHYFFPSLSRTGVPTRQTETNVVFYGSISNTDARVIPRRDAPARTQCAHHYFFPSLSRTGVPKRQMETTVVFYNSISNTDGRVIPRRDAPARAQCAQHYFFPSPSRTGVPTRQMEMTVVFYSSFFKCRCACNTPAGRPCICSPFKFHPPPPILIFNKPGI
jgi:hypothetical protein